MIVNGGDWRMRASGLKQLELTRRIGHPFVRVDFPVGWMGHRNQLKAVYVHHLFELICDAKLVSSVARLELIVAYSNILIRIRMIADAGRLPVPHLSAAHEISYKL